LVFGCEEKGGVRINFSNCFFEVVLYQIIIMKLILVLHLFTIISCKESKKSNEFLLTKDTVLEIIPLAIDIQNKIESQNVIDTEVSYFNKKFQFTLKALEKNEYDSKRNNSLFTISKLNNTKFLVRDSLSCYRTDINFQDYNHDGIEDILIYHDPGFRANTTYYLYLTDSKKKNFIRVTGFEKIPNASIDNNKIITSFTLGGQNSYSFYIINKNFNIKQIGKTVYSNDFNKDKLVEKEYKQIIKRISINNK
jgi:hypothetical protein